MNHSLKILKIAMVFISIILTTGCYTDYQNDNTSENPKRIELSDFRASLPYDKDVNLVESNCMICHSLEYINMQPALTEKQWEKTVDKMIKNFGAPVADSASRAAIIRYLVTIKGKK